MNDQPTPLNGPDPDAEQLRRLLSDAVDDIEPREALGTIHARTRVSPMNSKRSWILGAAAAVVATAATVTAVVVLSDGTTGDGDAVGPAASATPTPEPTPTPTEATPTPTPATEAVPVYYVGETSHGTRLFREFHRVETGGNPLAAALSEAVSTPPDDPDYRTGWPEGTVVNGAGFDGVGADGEVWIRVHNDSTDLHDRPAGMSAEQAQMAVEQLIYTAQAVVQDRVPVQILLGPESEDLPESRTDTLLGVPVSEPLAEGDEMDVLAQVWIIDPAENAEVTAPFKVSGLAAAFEANVLWELRQGDTVVAEGFTTTEECCKMAPYSFRVKDVPPGEYTLVVSDTDPSAGEGPAPWEDTKQITVLP